MKKSFRQRGDTLVEVLLATVVLSSVLAAAYTLSNRATRLNQQAFERTQVSNLLQQQAELVRAARDSYLPSSPSSAQSINWTNITARAQSTVNDNITAECANIATLPSQGRMTNAFHMIASGASATVGSGLLSVAPENIYKIWIEVEDGGFGEYWDVHVFSCWEGIADGDNPRTSLVLRLEDPN